MRLISHVHWRIRQFFYELFIIEMSHHRLLLSCRRLTDRELCPIDKSDTSYYTTIKIIIIIIMYIGRQARAFPVNFYFISNVFIHHFLFFWENLNSWISSFHEYYNFSRHAANNNFETILEIHVFFFFNVLQIEKLKKKFIDIFWSVK